ncbi:MAG: hypothetical protein MZV65_41445 [Chromatiales bacterium]|nr:hypothetical protein [Chromatiales bacterium]
MAAKRWREAIVAAGLTEFYRHRTSALTPAGGSDSGAVARAGVVRPAGSAEELRASPKRTRPRGRADPGRHRLRRLRLARTSATSVALPGVLEFRVNYSTHRARVRWDERQIRLSDILAAIAAIGYIAHPFDPSRQEALQKRERRRGPAPACGGRAGYRCR